MTRRRASIDGRIDSRKHSDCRCDERLLLERRGTPQPVGHVAQRFAFREVAGPSRFVTATPAPHPLTAQRSFLELEASLRGLGANVHARKHRARV